jgi:hypothetical protein
MTPTGTSAEGGFSPAGTAPPPVGASPNTTTKPKTTTPQHQGAVVPSVQLHDCALVAASTRESVSPGIYDVQLSSSASSVHAGETDSTVIDPWVTPWAPSVAMTTDTLVSSVPVDPVAGVVEDPVACAAWSNLQASLPVYDVAHPAPYDMPPVEGPVATVTVHVPEVGPETANHTAMLTVDPAAGVTWARE